MQISDFWVDIENASGDKLGSGPIQVGYFDISSPLSSSGFFEFSVSPADPNYGIIQEKRIAVCRYIDIDGAEQDFGSGIIEEIDQRVDDAGLLTVIISGADLTRETSYRSVRDLQIGDGIAGGDTDGPDQIMALAPAGWTISGGTTLQEVYVRYDGQTVLNALISLGEGIGEHWRLGSGRNIEWLNTLNEFTASGVRAIDGVPEGTATVGVSEIAFINSLWELKDSSPLVNRIYPRGAGNGSAILRLEALVDATPAGYTVNISEGYIEHDASVDEYDVIEREIDFKNISPISNSTADKQLAAGMLQKAAVEYLRKNAELQRFYEVELIKVDAILEPGTTIQVIYTKYMNDIILFEIDEILNILEVTERISNEGINTVGIKVSTIDRIPLTDVDITIGQLEQSKVVSTHAQLNANARNIDREGFIDNTHSLIESFWMGDEVASVKNVRLRFKITPLRSTVRTVAGQSTTTPSGGGGTTPSGGGATSGNGGAVSKSTLGGGGILTSTWGGGSVNEFTSVPIGAVFDGHYHFLDAPAHTHTFSLPNHQHNFTTPNHQHTVFNHTHSISNHTHTFTPIVDLAYGIFEETSGNTLTQSQINVAVNGVIFKGSVTEIGGGWYQADITDELVDDTFSPIRASNAITYSTITDKTAQITTSISIVDIVQAVSII